MGIAIASLALECIVNFCMLTQLATVGTYTDDTGAIVAAEGEYAKAVYEGIGGQDGIVTRVMLFVLLVVFGGMMLGIPKIEDLLHKKKFGSIESFEKHIKEIKHANAFYADAIEY